MTLPDGKDSSSEGGEMYVLYENVKKQKTVEIWYLQMRWPEQ